MGEAGFLLKLLQEGIKYTKDRVCKVDIGMPTTLAQLCSRQPGLSRNVKTECCRHSGVCLSRQDDRKNES